MPKYESKVHHVDAEFFAPETQPWPTGVKKDDCHPKGPLFLDCNDGSFESVVSGDVIVTDAKGHRHAWKRDAFDQAYQLPAAPEVEG